MMATTALDDDDDDDKDDGDDDYSDDADNDGTKNNYLINLLTTIVSFKMKACRISDGSFGTRIFVIYC